MGCCRAFETAASKDAGVATGCVEGSWWAIAASAVHPKLVCAVILGRLFTMPEEPSSDTKPSSFDSMSKPLSARRTTSNIAENKIHIEEAPWLLL
jgi:hypothetical protein